MIQELLSAFRSARARRLATSSPGRRIRIHSVSHEETAVCRVAFEFIEKPGPWSMQFYEASPEQSQVLESLLPGTEAKFHESRDGAKTRVMVLEDGRVVLPK